jgi:hypothetical protein
MYRNIFKKLEKRVNTFNSLTNDINSYVYLLQKENKKSEKIILKLQEIISEKNKGLAHIINTQREQIKILEAELQYAQSEINKGLND